MALLRNLKPDQIAKIHRPKFRGMAPDIDPQNLTEEQAYLAINSRILGGQHTMRGGERRLLTVTGKVTGLGTHKIGAGAVDGGPSLWIGGSVFNQNFKIRDLPPWRWASFSGHFLNQFNGDLLWTSDGTGTTNVCRFVQASVDYNQSGPDFGAVAEPVFPTVSGDPPKSGIDHFGDFLAASLPGIGASPNFLYVDKFDGVTVTRDKTYAFGVLGGTLEPNVNAYMNSVVVSFGGLPDGSHPNVIFIRSSAGVWSGPIAPTGGIASIGSPSVSAQFRNKFYLPKSGVNTHTGDAFVLDSAGVLTRLPAATTGVSATGYIAAFAVMRRNLYYVHVGAGDVGCWIGKYDGTTWNPTYKDLTAQLTFADYLGSNGSSYNPASWRIATALSGRLPMSMREYRGSLCLSVSNAGLYVSPKTTPIGNWQLSLGESSIYMLVK